MGMNLLIDKSEWVFQSSNKDVKVYMLADSRLHKMYLDEPNHPDYHKGMEYEPYMLYIIPSGFEDWYHTIIETPEWPSPEYQYLNSKQVLEQFEIKL